MLTLLFTEQRSRHTDNDSLGRLFVRKFVINQVLVLLRVLGKNLRQKW